MGFFDFMGRMAKGEPVFQDESNEKPASQQAPTPEPEGPIIKKGDPSTFPVVHITKVTPHTSGDHLQLYCHIENTWGKPVELDKIVIFNTKRELDMQLRAHEVRDVLVYDDGLLRHEDHEAVLQYKTEDGDYFEARYFVTFHYRPQNGTYDVAEIQLREEIRDIYG